MLKLLLLAFLALVPCTCLSAQAPSDDPGANIPDSLTALVRYSDSLPPGVLGRTRCTRDNRTLVEVRKPVSRETLIHEAVHVVQFYRAGGLDCNKGRRAVVKNKYTLLAAEAEAYCVQAMWAWRHRGAAPEVSLRMAAGWVTEASYRTTDERWHLSSTEVREAFIRACPGYVEPVPPAGLTVVQPPSSMYRVTDPLTNTIQSSYERYYAGYAGSTWKPAARARSLNATSVDGTAAAPATSAGRPASSHEQGVEPGREAR